MLKLIFNENYDWKFTQIIIVYYHPSRERFLSYKRYIFKLYIIRDVFDTFNVKDVMVLNN